MGKNQLINRGFNWVDFAWIVIAALACSMTKANVFIALPLLIMVVIIAFTQTSKWWIRGFAFGLIPLVGLVSLIY